MRTVFILLLVCLVSCWKISYHNKKGNYYREFSTREFHFNDSITYQLISHDTLCFSERDYHFFELDIKPKLPTAKEIEESRVSGGGVYPTLVMNKYEIVNGNCTGFWNYKWSFAMLNPRPYVPRKYNIIYKSANTFFAPAMHDSTDRVKFWDSVIIVNHKELKEEKYDTLKRNFMNGFLRM